MLAPECCIRVTIDYWNKILEETITGGFGVEGTGCSVWGFRVLGVLGCRIEKRPHRL